MMEALSVVVRATFRETLPRNAAIDTCNWGICGTYSQQMAEKGAKRKGETFWVTLNDHLIVSELELQVISFILGKRSSKVPQFRREIEEAVPTPRCSDHVEYAGNRS